MWILRFTGKGYGLMSGVTEYLNLLEEAPDNEDKEPAPGFTLVHVIDTDTDDPCNYPLPFDRTLVVR